MVWGRWGSVPMHTLNKAPKTARHYIHSQNKPPQVERPHTHSNQTTTGVNLKRKQEKQYVPIDTSNHQHDGICTRSILSSAASE